jgi:diacylglycerol kinase (ATP)
MTRQDGVIQVKSLAKSFKNAFNGITFCIKNERNMRIHLILTFYVLVFSPFYHFTQEQMLLLLLAIGLVLFAEAVNTAIEAIVNLETQSYDHLARIAKDVAAGAVLICAIFAAVVGVILFLKMGTIALILHYLSTVWILGVLFLVSLPISLAFICGLPLIRTFIYLKKH